LLNLPAQDAGRRPTLRKILDHPALQRLERGVTLRTLAAVQHYQALGERQGPPAGSEAATSQGRAAAQAGQRAEDATLQAFRRIAELLNATHSGNPYRVVRSLRPPAGFPGASAQAKDEWDTAIVRDDTDGAAHIVLLAEAKASPTAAAPDLPRLLRGLRRLAQADSATRYPFWSADGEVQLAGASLRVLRPHRGALPEPVIYCCCAPVKSQPQLLGPVSKAVLLAEPASLEFAQRLLRGDKPAPADLAPVWQALASAPHLRAILHQDATARTAREAMLHPDDLLAAVNARLPA